MVPTDATYMALALEQARKGEGHTRPNPPVGAVIVRDGEILGAGYHHRCGKPHAEVMALTNLRRRHPNLKTEDLKRSTLYVTLEPCSKAGRVGACTDAIIASGITRIVYACVDPNPTNRGRARRILARHGIECLRLNDRHSAVQVACDALIAPFTKHVATGIPYVTVKIAMSLDGKICDTHGDARWISSETMRKLTGRLRERVDAILVGGETVRRDNPSLLSHGKANADLVRVVVSRSGKLPQTSQIFTDGKNETLVFRDAKEALEELGRRGLLHVLCEGGMKLATSMAEAGLVDEWITVLAPKVIGTRPIHEAVHIAKSTILNDQSK